ncbi:MAG: hypothetical protein GY934_01105, partial [Gammaproteobacteria bacterium]|nr:hypothetical protein [Gammaproteobacteria bacterium]
MSIAHTFNSQDAPTRTIEPREGPEQFPDKDHSAAPYGDAHLSLEAYQAYDEGYLAEAPWALEAY